MPKRTADALSVELPNKKVKQVQFHLLGSDISVLAQFVQLSETDDSEYLIEEALRSPTVMGILNFLDVGRSRKKSELLTIFRSLHSLILHGTLFGQSSELKNIVRELAEGVLEDPRFSTILYGLKSSQGAETIKTTLRLMAAVVNVGVDLARGLLRSLNFESQDLVLCSKRRNKSDPQDVRSCFLNLVGSFVFQDNNLLIREVVDKKNALSLVINESSMDKYADLMLILHLLQKVVENCTVSKTQKMHLFSRVVLKNLLYLYTWQDFADASTFNSDNPHLISVRSKLHELLSVLTTSTRFGLVFCIRRRDTDRPSNTSILYALTCPPMEAAHTDPLRSDLVVQSLLSCPDIIPHYLDHTAPLIQPRTSSKSWFSSMRLVYQIFESVRLHLVNFTMTALNQWPESQQVARFIVNCCFLSPKMVQPLGNALHYTDDAEVVNESNAVMKILQLNITILLTWISTTDCSLLNSSSAASLKDEIHLLVRERTPTTRWMKRLEKVFSIQHFDATLLSDQVCLQRKSEETENVNSVAPVQSIEEDFGLTLEDFRPLPCDVRKPMKYIFKHSHLVGTELPVKVTEALTVLSTNAVHCVSTCLHLPAVSYCLAIGLRLVRGTAINFANPKDLLKSLVANPEFSKLLFTDVTPSTEAPTEPPQNDVTSRRQNTLLKDSVVELLLELSKECPKACVNRIPSIWLLSSYGATLSSTDRKILRILFLLDTKSPFYIPPCEPSSSPLLWGSTTRAHYQFPDPTTFRATRLPQPVLFHSPSLNVLFSLLKEDTLLLSAIHFSANRNWLTQHTSDFFGDPNMNDTNLFDPCFVLHVLDRYLSHYSALISDSNGVIQSSLDQFLRMFHSRHCLAFAVAALSSYSKHLRALSRSIIAKFRDLAFNWKPTRLLNVKSQHIKLSTQLFPERLQVVFILDLLRNSLASGGGLALGGSSRKRWMFSCKLDTGGRLTRLHANFFVRCLQLLNNPGNHLYQPMWNRLLAKPAINLAKVPDFLRYFFSTHNMFRVERHFICRLCVDSMDDTADYLVMEGSRVFKHILAAYSSPSSDCTFQLLVLRLLAAATRHPRIAHALVRFHALPLWLWRHALAKCPSTHITQFHIILTNMLHATSRVDVESPLSTVLPILMQEFR